jgi:hypothetical protein
MKRIIKQLFWGFSKAELFDTQNAFTKQVQLISDIWQNPNLDSFGIERLVRLFLATTQLFVPVMLIKVVFEKWGYFERKLAVETYLLFKIAFPLCCIFQEWYNYIALIINVLFLCETLLYLANLVFLSDVTKPHSYRRALLFVFLNYIEIALGFAALYDYLNKYNLFSANHAFQNKLEPIYFSFVTAASIGYGDFVPATSIGEFLVILQSLIFFLFVAIFMGFFVGKVE